MSLNLQPYRLFLSEDEWTRLPDKLRDPYFQSLAEDNRKALRFLDEERGESIIDVPGMLGAGGERRRPHARVMKKRLLCATVAWYLERDESHLASVRDTLDFLVENGPGAVSYGLPWLRYADLKTADEWYVAAFALDVLSPFLDDARIEALLDLLRNGLNAYLKGIQADEWWRHAEFNWGTSLHGNAGLAALAIQPYEPELAQRVLHEALDGIQYVIDAFPPGGGWIEGLMYQCTTVGHLTDFVAALVRVEGDDLGLSRNQNFIDTFTYRMYMFGGDGRGFNFSDVSDIGNQCSLPHNYWWAQRCNHPDWTWFEDQNVIPWSNTGGVFHAVEAFWYRPALPDSSAPVLKPLKHFQGLDWVTWHGDRTWLAFRGGFNGGNHCNRDLGHFIFGAGHDRFLIDPGYGANHAGQHNSVTIRHQDQTDCATAPVFRLRPRPGGFYLACDLSDAFPHSLAYYYRHLLLIDDAHLLVLDDLLGRAGRRLGAAYHLQTRCPVQYRDDILWLEGEEHTLAVRRLAPSDVPEVADAEWRRLSYTVVSWHDASDRIHAVHPVLFSLEPAEASFSREGDVFCLHLNGATHRIDLAEGSLVLAH